MVGAGFGIERNDQPSEDRDIYELHPLLHPALPDHPHLNAKSPAAISLAVRCAEGNGSYRSLRLDFMTSAVDSPLTLARIPTHPLGRNLYVGSSNGLVHHYVLGDQGSSSNVSLFRR